MSSGRDREGSGYISRQCYGSTEIELGTVYEAEMGITLLSDIDRYTLEDALVTLVFHLVLAMVLWKMCRWGFLRSARRTVW